VEIENFTKAPSTDRVSRLAAGVGILSGAGVLVYLLGALALWYRYRALGLPQGTALVETDRATVIGVGFESVVAPGLFVALFSPLFLMMFAALAPGDLTGSALFSAISAPMRWLVLLVRDGEPVDRRDFVFSAAAIVVFGCFAIVIPWEGAALVPLILAGLTIEFGAFLWVLFVEGGRTRRGRLLLALATVVFAAITVISSQPFYTGKVSRVRIVFSDTTEISGIYLGTNGDTTYVGQPKDHAVVAYRATATDRIEITDPIKRCRPPARSVLKRAIGWDLHVPFLPRPKRCVYVQRTP
jgi:hypothetical protein